MKAPVASLRSKLSSQIYSKAFPNLDPNYPFLVHVPHICPHTKTSINKPAEDVVVLIDYACASANGRGPQLHMHASLHTQFFHLGFLPLSYHSNIYWWLTCFDSWQLPDICLQILSNIQQATTFQKNLLQNSLTILLL